MTPVRRRITRKWRAAAVQMTSTEDVARNLAFAEKSIRAAAAAGAQLVALPENFAFLRYEGSPVTFKQPLDGELVGSMRALARELRCHLLLGSFPEHAPRQKRIYNTSVLIGPDGALLATYRKMHLFDIDIPGGVSFKESSTVKPGAEPVLADTRLGRLGLSICYDLRFPEYYRCLALAGAQVLFVPAAFTAFTGPPHWLPLLRARAIENQCWVVAPAQVGRHNAQRASHGESVIIDPWGTVVRRLRRATGWIDAEIDLDEVDRVRRGLPCLTHTRPGLLASTARRASSPRSR